MEIKEILPGKINLKIERIDAPLALNLLTVEDNIWLDDTFPDGGLDKILREVKVKDLIKVVLRMIDLPTKRLLGRMDIVDVDEKGHEIKLENLTLNEKLCKLINEGEVTAIIDAIIESKKRSNEIVTKFNEKYKKKPEEDLQTGKPSSISSPVSTESLSVK